jgi:hypothetical protein
MPPRRSARAAAAASSVTTLPHTLVLLVFARLPADARLLAAAVCRGWRAALSDAGLWLRLDLSAASGVSPTLTATHGALDGLLRAAAARAGGQLQTLDVRGASAVSDEALLAVVGANGGSLRSLTVTDVAPLTHLAVRALLRAAPQLEAFDADAVCFTVDTARSMLRKQAPFGPLRVRRLLCYAPWPDTLADAALRALAAEVARSAGLRELCVRSFPRELPAAFDALADAAIACRLPSLRLHACGFSLSEAPAIARVVRGGALAELHLECDSMVALHAPAAELLGDALRASATLTAVSVHCVRTDTGAAVTVLLDSLTGHARLRSLALSAEPCSAAAAHDCALALGAVVAANAPALTELDVSGCRFSDARLGPLFAALPANTHLRTLQCGGAHLTDAFMRDSVLPAVRANSSLRELRCVGACTRGVHAHEAEALVQRRREATE